MEAYNAAAAAVALGLTPLSVLSKRQLALAHPRKNIHLPAIPRFHPQSFPALGNSVSTTLYGGGLSLLSSILNSQSAKALSYDETLHQSTVIAAANFTLDFDVSAFLDTAINFTNDNPLIVGGGAAVFLVPLLVAQLFNQSRPWGVVGAKNAYRTLAEEPDAQLLDIRSPAEIRQAGSPNIKGLKKKLVAVVYNGEDKPGFLKKLSLKFKEPQTTTLFILDKFNGNSELVAELVTANGFKAAYAITDGAEGSRGWKNSGLPWILPSKSLINLGSLTDALGDAADAAPLVLGIAAAAAGLGLLAFTEVETVLQVLGTAAAVQFVSKKLLFAEDRKQTIQQLEELLNTKVAPKELVDDIQEIGKALLPPVTVTSKALPAAAEANPASDDSPVQKSDFIPEAETTPEVNSVPQAEIQGESLPAHPRPLSPYPNYPDYKPPSSPMPSQP